MKVASAEALPRSAAETQLGLLIINLLAAAAICGIASLQVCEFAHGQKSHPNIHTYTTHVDNRANVQTTLTHSCPLLQQEHIYNKMIHE